jgi:hypothetical protein
VFNSRSSSSTSTLLYFVTFYHPVRLSLSALIQQCFSLTTNQHQPELAGQKPTSKQSEFLLPCTESSPSTLVQPAKCQSIKPPANRRRRPRERKITIFIFLRWMLVSVHVVYKQIKSFFYIKPHFHI